MRLAYLIETLPEWLRPCHIEGEGATLRQHWMRVQCNHQPLVLTGLPGPWLVVNDGQEYCEPRRLRYVSVPAVVSDFAVRVGEHLNHDWAKQGRLVYGDNQRLNRDGCWLRSLALDQMNFPIPAVGGTEAVAIDSVLQWVENEGSPGYWAFNHRTRSGRLVITTNNSLGDDLVAFTVTVSRAEGGAFTLQGTYAQECVELAAATLGGAQIFQRHIIVAAELLGALEPETDRIEPWKAALCQLLGIQFPEE